VNESVRLYLELIRVVEIRPRSRRNSTAILKVLYLMAVTAIAFTLPAFSWMQAAQWFVVPALLTIQIVALLICRIKPAAIANPAWRLKWLFLFLIAAYALLPAEAPSDARIEWPMPGVEWRLVINLTGLDHAGLMCLQIITVVLASALVRLTGNGRDLVDGLQSFHLPPLFVYSLDRTLELLAGRHRPGSGGGAGRRNRSAQGGFLAVLKRALRGDIGFFVESIRANMRDSAEQADRENDRQVSAELGHDVAVVTGIALAMASLKLVKLLPGVPFASGHKVLFLFPLYVLAARLTHSRWGGTVAGSIMGVIAFLQGDGRFGVLEILKHVAPGLVIDLADPFIRRLPAWALGYSILGLAAAVARTTTEFAVVFLLGSRAEVYVFPAARLVPNLLAGFLSGFVTIFVLRAFRPASRSNAGDAAAQTSAPVLATGEQARGACSPATEAHHPPCPSEPKPGRLQLSNGPSRRR
jgi:hypothetical protein